MKRVIKLNKVLGKLDSAYADEIKKIVKDSNLDADDIDVYRKSYAIETKAKLEDGSRTVIKYVSTRTVDQIGDVVVPKGMSFKQFKKTGMPVFYNHNYSMPQIGRDEWVKVDDYGVKVKMKYADLGEGTLADILWKLTSQDMNKQSSVGLIPLEVIRETDDNFSDAIKTLSKEWPEFKSTRKACKRIITKSIMFEHSDCASACNTDTEVLAVSKAFTEAGADEALLKQLGLPLMGIVKDEATAEDKEPIISDETIKDAVGDAVKEIVEELDLEEVKVDIEIVDETNETNETKETKETKETNEEVKEAIVEVPVVKKVTLVRQPRVVKFIHGPSVTKAEFDEIVQAEIRKKKGRLL